MMHLWEMFELCCVKFGDSLRCSWLVHLLEIFGNHRLSFFTTPYMYVAVLVVCISGLYVYYLFICIPLVHLCVSLFLHIFFKY